MSEPAYEFGVVCEGPADERTACVLADRVLRESIDWLDLEYLNAMRRWRGEGANEKFLKWSSIKDRANQAGLKIFGGFDARPDALGARKALLLFAGLKQPPNAVLLIRDSDGDPGRKDAQGLKQARDSRRWPFKILIGVAHPKREA